MKTFNQIISSLMVALMLVTSVPYVGFSVGAVSEETGNYTLTLEATLADSFTAENSAEGMVSFFEDSVFDGCYGNQLSGVARELYDSLVKNYVTDKITGEHIYVFETPFTFNAEISDGSIVMNDELEEIETEIHYALQMAMDAFLYDHPEVFWLKIIGSSYGISTSGNDVNGYTGIIDDITIIPTEIYSGALSNISQYDTAVNSVLASVSVTESRYDTLKNIHDYICNNAWYNLVSEQRVHSSEPFFIGDGGVVCEGYAKTFKVLCDRLDIPCVLVSGDAGGAHMWNYVQMDDGKWYLVDVTWDDQENQIYDTYFLANANTIGFDDVAISEERTERTDFSGTSIFSFTYPVLSATAYTVHIHEWESDYTVDVEPTCTKKGSKSIHCKTCDETKSVTEISTTNHANKTEHAQQDATCIENGYTTGVYCSDCDEWLEGHKIITSEGHNDTDQDNVCNVCEEYLSIIVDSGSCGVNVFYTFYQDGTIVISGSGKMKDYKYTGSLRPPWSSYGSLIKNVLIKNGVTSVGNWSFSYCRNLTKVEMCDSVLSIGYDAFYACTSLLDVKLSDNLSTISALAFASCESIQEIVIPESVTSIDYSVFQDCYNLGTIVIPDSVTKIGNQTFYNCLSLESVTLGKNLSDIGNYAFVNCSSLTKFYVDEENENFSYENGILFNKNKTVLIKYGEGKLESNYEIPVSVVTIERSAFENCKNLKEVYFSDNIETIQSRAFYGCENLNNIKLPDSVISIGASVFSNCVNLKSICLSNGLISIGDSAFHSCTSLQKMIIPDSTTSIGSQLFRNCVSLKEVVFGKSLKKISDYALYDCKNLISVTISDSITSIESFSFYGCKNMNEIIISSSIATISAYAFDECVKLQDVYYVGSIEQWNEMAIATSGNEYFSRARIHNNYIVDEQHYSCEVTKKPTCTTRGIETYTCMCGYSFTSTIARLGHNYSPNYTIDKMATCTVGGSKSKHCIRTGCTEKMSVTSIAKTPHTEIKISGKGATCKNTGLADGKKCSVCGTVTLAQKTIVKKAHTYDNACDKNCNVCKATRNITHSYKITTTKATLSQNGKAVTKCTVCGTVAKMTTIYYPKTIKLSVASYTYNGKTKTPTVTVKDSKGKTLKKGTDYTVTYPKKRKSVGKYTVTVKFKGNFSGTKKLTFEIVPAKATLSKLTAGSKQLTANWKTVSGATGYEVVYSTSKKFTKKTTKTVTIKKAKPKKTTIKKLKKGKKYFVKVRAYKMVSGKKVYGAWSSVKSVKVE